MQTILCGGYSLGQRLGPDQPQPSDKRPPLNTVTEHTGCSKSPLTLSDLLRHHQVLNSYLVLRNGSGGAILHP